MRLNFSSPFLVVLLGLVFEACRSTGLAGVDSWLELEPTRVEAPRAYVGNPTRASLKVRNTGRATLPATFEATGPFQVERGPLEVPGGSSVTISLLFLADVVGPAEGRLKVVSGEAVLEATLVGEAVPIPLCPSRGECQTARFDVPLERCLYENVANDTACGRENQCVQEGRCTDGECLGQAVDCEDSNACTTDGCNPESGCVHFPATARCGASANPCQSPVCDPLQGCTFVDAADGERCGPSDCTTAHICRLGACQVVPLSDGAACGSESPCQRPGLCEGQVCRRPEATELVAAWTVWAHSGYGVYWDSIGDADGNVYWREMPSGSSGSDLLVSVTRNGYSRFSVPVMHGPQMMLAGKLLLIRSGGFVVAYRATDGKMAWVHDVLHDIRAGASPLKVVAAQTQLMARGPDETLYVGFDERGEGEPAPLNAGWIARVDLATGNFLWKVRLEGLFLDGSSNPVDEEGYLYLGTYSADGKRWYLSFTPQGRLRWYRENPHAQPAAVFGGRVYHWDHWLSETATGEWVNLEPPTLSGLGYPRLALGAVNFVGTTAESFDSCSSPGTLADQSVLHLTRVDPPTSTLRWTLEIAGPRGGSPAMTNTLLTSRASVLFSQAEDYCDRTATHVLREVSTLGEPVFSCRLPGPARYWGEGLLNAGLWVAAVTEGTRTGVRGFDLPGFELPEHGWATANGSPARDGHSR